MAGIDNTDAVSRIAPLIQQLTEARRNKGISQTDLARLLGIRQSYVSRIESGHTDLRVSTLVDFARYLDLEPVLVPRTLVPAVSHLIAGEMNTSPFQYRLPR